MNLEEVNSQQLNHFINEGKWSYHDLEESVTSFFYDLLDDEGMSDDCCLIIDESAIPKKGKASAGVKRQYCGQLGKVENCQVGVFGALCSGSLVNLVQGKLSTEDGLNKLELAKEIILDVKVNKRIDFGWVVFDAFYGRDSSLLCNLVKQGISIIGDVPGNLTIYLDKFQMRIPKKNSARGRDPIHPKPNKVGMRIENYVNELKKTDWQKIKIRHKSDGELLTALFHETKVYILNPNTNRAQMFTLLVRKELDGSNIKYSLCWDNKERNLQTWAYRQSKRFFIEKSFREGKQELGMKDYQVRSEIAFQKHMSMIMLAQLFLNTEKLYGLKKMGKLFSVGSLVKIINANDRNIEKTMKAIMKIMEPKEPKTKPFYKKQLKLRI
jgi:SRSO17 transposase